MKVNNRKNIKARIYPWNKIKDLDLMRSLIREASRFTTMNHLFCHVISTDQNLMHGKSEVVTKTYKRKPLEDLNPLMV